MNRAAITRKIMRALRDAVLIGTEWEKVQVTNCCQWLLQNRPHELLEDPSDWSWTEAAVACGHAELGDRMPFLLTFCHRDFIPLRDTLRDIHLGRLSEDNDHEIGPENGIPDDDTANADDNANDSDDDEDNATTPPPRRRRRTRRPRRLSPRQNRLLQKLSKCPEVETCTICLTGIRSNVCRIHPCAHLFHVACMKKHLKLAVSCPMCRAQIDDVSRTIYGK